MLENVKYLTLHNNKKTFKTICNKLEDLGYNVSHKILNSKDFGVPQSRERIIIIATQNGFFDFSKLETHPKKYLNDILQDTGNFEYLDYSEYTLLEEKYIHPQPKTGLIFCGYRNKNTWKKGIREGTMHLSRCHRQPNRIYSSDGIHPTIPSQETSGRFWVYIPKINKVRKLTIRECYRLMGFPESFVINSKLSEVYKQIGNSVVIPMIITVAKEIIKQGFLGGNNGNFGTNIQPSFFE